MSPTTPTEPTQSSLQAPSAKKKSNKKKKSANKPKPLDTDGGKNGGDALENDDLTDEPVTPGVSEGTPHSPVTTEASANGHATTMTKPTNGHAVKGNAEPANAASDTSAKLEAMSQEREALRAEVEKLRKQLESIQETHGAEVSQLKTELEESEAAKEQAESQYETLMGRVAHIKETLGDRLKRDKAELDEAKDRIEDLEKENEELRNSTQSTDSQASRLRDELQEQSRELSNLRSRNNLSQQNWLKEKDDMTRQMQHLRSELESTSAAMGEWEVIAMEERSMRESLADKAADLEEQLTTLRESYDRAAEERATQSQAIDGLQRALQEIQEARKRELREMVETSEEQLTAMKKLVQDADARAKEAGQAREALAKELERTAPFEKEVKEKSLLIGKLRHEAIGLNEHLTRALKYIKKNKPEEMIDRQVVTNHFLQFLALDRSDPRKFQILQVIAGLLNWTDGQKEQAGLARPGTANNSLRLPASPFHRTPSSPALNSEFFTEPTSAGGKESLADLWAGFLERSVEEAGSNAGGLSSRKDSMSSIATATTRPDTRGQQN